jgi:hypothetical protein
MALQQSGRGREEEGEALQWWGRGRGFVMTSVGTKNMTNHYIINHQQQQAQQSTMTTLEEEAALTGWEGSHVAPPGANNNNEVYPLHFSTDHGLYTLRMEKSGLITKKNLP